MARLDRYRIGIPRELSEIRTQPWLSEGSLTCDHKTFEPVKPNGTQQQLSVPPTPKTSVSSKGPLCKIIQMNLFIVMEVTSMIYE